MNKTNAMRLLDKAKIEYEVAEYEVDENDLSGVHVATILNQPVEQVFKTLVAKGEKNGIMVFCIPVAEELNLKKAAIATKDKKIELLPMKELLPTTGYIRGGCSPIGMKKHYNTYIEESAILYDKIYISAGVRGAQIIINPEQLKDFVKAEFKDLL
ncbi:MAG: Cys-tRNA(Pro) deacylase [Lachnospiraceae bacterium]|nr:Cys-tRNA(Pro) deacylase [Falcatimonas sp. MSJ-15]MBU5471343.1 Cys-tRNA(Pro) deacylase [Falcatimonas sp. MSJ-15]MEE0959816.1 Cys-tRNA(Pro) deacylase [Lachnospiraceae bacterium]